MFTRPIASRLSLPARRGAPRRRPGPPGRQARPAVEALEDRWAPATFLVTSAADAGVGTLRQAILDANATPQANTITFALPLTGQTILLASALPPISQLLTITGLGQNNLTVSGNNAFRVFDIAPSITARVADLTVTQGAATAAGDKGGAIRNAGSLALQHVTVSASRAAQAGGGVHNGPGAIIQAPIVPWLTTA